MADRSLCNIDQPRRVAAGIIGWRTEGDMAFNEPHLILRDATPVLIRRPRRKMLPSIPIFSAT